MKMNHVSTSAGYKVTNLAKFWPIKNVFGSIPRNSPIFFYEKFSLFDGFFEDVELQSRKGSNKNIKWNKQISWKVPFLNHHMKEFF